MTKNNDTNVNLDKEKRIKSEISRLGKSFKNIDEDKFRLAEGLIKRAAFMRITLEDYEKDLLLNGCCEMFSQSEKTEPYERERPVARLYNSLNKNYQTIIKQLTDLSLNAKKQTDSNNDENDGFDDYVKNR